MIASQHTAPGGQGGIKFGDCLFILSLSGKRESHIIVECKQGGIILAEGLSPCFYLKPFGIRGPLRHGVMVPVFDPLGMRVISHSKDFTIEREFAAPLFLGHQESSYSTKSSQNRKSSYRGCG